MATTTAVHIGVKPENVNYITVLQNRLGNQVAVDTDGWNSWGEKPGTDVNDADTLHLVIGPFDRVEQAERVARALVEQRGETLMPMDGHEQQRGIKAVVTNWDDWSADYLYLY